MTMTTFFADRAVVRMVGQQKLDDRRAEILGLFVGDRNERAVRCRRHARHDDAARLVALVAIRLERTMATRASVRPRDRKRTRVNSSNYSAARMPTSA